MREPRIVWWRGGWYVVWYEDGKRRRASLRTKDRDDAERALLDAQRAEIGPTVADMMAAYLADLDQRAAAPERARDAWKALAPHFGRLRPDHITRATCRAYTRRRTLDGRKPGTINKELGVLRAGIRWADPHHKAQFEMPSPPDPRDRHLTKGEFNALLAACGAPHVRLFCVIAIATGGRATAILDLTWNRVDLDRGIVRLKADDAARRKGRATVPLNDMALGELRRMRDFALSPYVIEWAGQHVTSIKKGVQRAAARAGLSGVTPHVLRHTAAVWMAEAGVPMAEIAAFLGHADSRITERVYARFSPDHLRQAARALEWR